MSFPIINIQNEWSICKTAHQVPIWFVFNLSQLLEQSLMCSQKSAAFFPFPKKEFKALRVGSPQLSQDKQMVLRGGTSLQERLWFSKSSIVSEPCECPAGADSSENQTGTRPVSLGVPAVNHNRERRATWFKEPRTEKDLQGCQVQLLVWQVRNSAQGGQATYPRSLSWMVADLIRTTWPLSPWRCMAPGRPGCHWETHGHACTAMACLTASKKTCFCNADDEVKLATNWLIGSKLCEAVRNTLSWSEKHIFLRSDHLDGHFRGPLQWCCTSLP